MAIEISKTYILGQYLEIVKREGTDIFGGKYDFEELIEFVVEYWKKEAQYWEQQFHEANAVLEDPSLMIVR